MYARLLDLLRRSLYARGYVLDPYSVMEVATLVANYIRRCEESSWLGAVGLLSKILGKAGVDDSEDEARGIIREVVELLGGCEENHRLRMSA